MQKRFAIGQEVKSLGQKIERVRRWGGRWMGGLPYDIVEWKKSGKINLHDQGRQKIKQHAKSFK